MRSFPASASPFQPQTGATWLELQVGKAGGSATESPPSSSIYVPGVTFWGGGSRREPLEQTHEHASKCCFSTA